MEITNMLRQFAEPKKHAKWRYPRGKDDFDTFSEAVNALGDHAVYDRPTEELIGISLRNASEAKRLGNFVSALELVLKEVGRYEQFVSPAGPYLDHPGWQNVIQTARDALRTFSEPDYEGV